MWFVCLTVLFCGGGAFLEDKHRLGAKVFPQGGFALSLRAVKRGTLTVSPTFSFIDEGPQGADLLQVIGAEPGAERSNLHSRVGNRPGGEGRLSLGGPGGQCSWGRVGRVRPWVLPPTHPLYLPHMVSEFL